MKIAIAGMTDVDRIWPTIAEGITKSCQSSFDSISAGELLQMCRNGSAFLFIAHDEKTVAGASIWQFRRVDNKPVFQALALYGADFGEWFQPMRETIRQVAIQNGAVSLIDYARPGMGKLYRKYGSPAKVAFVAYEEEL